MSIAFIDLAAQQAKIKDKIDARVQAVLAHGKYILGPEVKELEEQLSTFSNVKHALTCGNGTDALLLALMALNVRSGDAVFCPSFTFAATAEVVPCMGAVPVFVDCDETTFNMDIASLKQAILDTKKMGLNPVGIIPVDLFGLSADYQSIQEIAKDNGLWIIGDGAQGYGAELHGQNSNNFCDITTTSFFPAKPLGCYGDGGAVFTNNDELADLITSYRFHGKGDHKYNNERIGMNSRLDTIQAAILLEKLALYADEIEKRNVVAARYAEGLADTSLIAPTVPDGYKSVWAQYTVKAKDEAHRTKVTEGLKARSIPTAVYYPLPLHQQIAYKNFPTSSQGLPVSESLSKRVFSLPMHPYLSEDDQDKIIAAIQSIK